MNGISCGIFWTNGTELFFSKQMNRTEPYRLIPNFFSEILPQGAWHQVIDKWFGNSPKLPVELGKKK